MPAVVVLSSVRVHLKRTCILIIVRKPNTPKGQTVHTQTGRFAAAGGTRPDQAASLSACDRALILIVPPREATHPVPRGKEQGFNYISIFFYPFAEVTRASGL